METWTAFFLNDKISFLSIYFYDPQIDIDCKKVLISLIEKDLEDLINNVNGYLYQHGIKKIVVFDEVGDKYKMMNISIVLNESISKHKELISK